MLGSNSKQIKIGNVAELTRTVADTGTEFFNAISGDRNSLHYDEKFAKASRFVEILVQGGITSAVLSAVVAVNSPARVLFS